MEWQRQLQTVSAVNLSDIIDDIKLTVADEDFERLLSIISTRAISDSTFRQDIGKLRMRFRGFQLISVVLKVF